MSDFREELGRLARRIQVGEDPIVRVRRRAERLQRTRRITAAFIALAITAAGVGLSFAAFRPGDSSRPAGSAAVYGGLIPIWPDGTAEDIDELQRRVDDGRETWRRNDPNEVARAFAVEEMVWESSDVETRIIADDPVTVAISNPSLAETVGSDQPIETTLYMGRWRGRGDGILVVTGAENDLLEISTPVPGQVAPPGKKVRFEGSISPVAKALDLILTLSGKGGATSLSSTEASEPSADGTYDLEGSFGGKDVQELRFFLDQVDMSSQNLDEVHIAFTALLLDPRGQAPTQEEDPPVPGPTATTVEPIAEAKSRKGLSLSVVDATGLDADTVIPYTVLLFQDIDSLADTQFAQYYGVTRDETVPSTRIFCDPDRCDEASELERTVLPGAEIRAEDPEGEINLEIVLGQDFANREDNGIRAFALVRSFMAARHAGEGAEQFLNEDAERQYRDEEGGLSLYGYSKRSHDVTLIRRLQDDVSTYVIVVRIPQGGNLEIYETLHVGTAGIKGQRLYQGVLYAERNQ